MHRPPQQRQLQVPNLQGGEWFTGAPASKLLIGFSVVLYLVVSEKSAAWQMDSSSMMNHGNFYRYFTSKCTFLSTGEVVVGTAMQIFLLRKYERELGTRKFLVFVLFVTALAILQEAILLQLITSRNRVLDLPIPLRWQYAGPYAVLGALFAVFHCYAPRLHPRFVSVLGFHFSEKAFYYLWFLHLICSGGWHTVVPTVTGVIAAAVYLKGLQEYVDFPDWLVRIVRPAVVRLRLSEAPVFARGMHPAAAAAAATTQLPYRPIERPAAQEIPMPEPDPSAVEQLLAMGFPQPQVLEALRQSHNNVEHAANRLLSAI